MEYKKFWNRTKNFSSGKNGFSKSSYVDKEVPYKKPMLSKEVADKEVPYKKPMLSKEAMEEARKQTSIQEIEKCLKDYKKILNNDRLEKIVLAYLNENELNEIELLAIPRKTTSTYNVKPKYKLEDIIDANLQDIDMIRYTLVSGFNRWKTNKGCMNYLSTSETYQKSRHLFDSLVSSKIITSSYETFCLYISEKQRFVREKKFLEVLSKYDLTGNENHEEIIRKLYDLNVAEKKICTIIALYDFMNVNEEMYIKSYENAEKNVHEQIIKIDQENFIARLESGKSEEKLLMEEIDLMSGAKFETFIANLFEKMGYNTEVTKTSGDQGVDVIAKKRGYVIAIQAKCYSGVVGNHAIMEAVAGSKFYKANKCMVITNSLFTKSAKELAKANNVELWDRQVLKEKMEEI